MENYYRLTKKELSFISSIEPPVVSSCVSRLRLSRPVVIARLGNSIIHVWTISGFRYMIKCGYDMSLYTLEIHSMY